VGLFLPQTSVLRQFRFQLIVVSRFLSEIGQEGVFYGALVTVARDGSPFQASVMGAAKLLPGAALGLFGGVVADALPRRVALGLGYLIQAAACVVFPIFLGTGFAMLLTLVLGVSTINQVIGPSEKAVLPLVTGREDMSKAASLMSLSDSIGSGLGTAAVAPIILVAFGVQVLLFVCGAFLIFAAVRILALPVQKNVTVKEALRRLGSTELDLGFRKALSWLMGWPAIVTIMMVGMVVSVLSNITETLGPTYVDDVLHDDPTRSVYVFAPAGAGALVALAVSPWVVGRVGERVSAAIAVLIMTLALFSMAFMEPLAAVLGGVNPLNVVRLMGLQPSDELLGAAFVSTFTGFAVSMSSVSVQTYLNRRVPVTQQGRVFGLQSVLVNAAALVPMLLLGLLAEATSIQALLFFAPWIVLAGVYGLLGLASRLAHTEKMSRHEISRSFWYEPETANAGVS
jgi:MFS family permease